MPEYRYFQKQVDQGETDLDPAEWSAKVVFTDLGFKVERIPRDHRKTPDFRVSDGTETYVVEVASRYLPDEFTEHNLNVYWDAKVNEWLGAAWSQSSTIDPKHDHLWILWCAAEADDDTIAAAQANRVFHSLFGVRRYREQAPSRREAVAIYAAPPLYQRVQAIDCAVVTAGPGRVGILPNTFSPRAGQLKTSAFLRNAEAHGFRVFWPTEHLSDQKIVVPDSIDRTDEAAVLNYIRSATKMPSLALLGQEMTIKRTPIAAPKK